MSLDVEMPTFEALKTRLTDNYRKRMEQQADQDFENRLVNELIKISKIEYPSNLVDMEYERLVKNQMDRWRSQVNSEAELEELLGRVNPEDLAKKLRPMAEERIKISLALGKLSSAENITVSDADVDAEITRMMEAIPEEQRISQSQQFETPEARDQIVQVLLSRKTVERLKQIATGQATVVAVAEPLNETENEKENKKEV